MEGFKEMSQNGEVERWSKTDFLCVHEGDVVTILSEDYYNGRMTDRFTHYAFCSTGVTGEIRRGWLPLNVLRFPQSDEAEADTIYV